MMSYFVLLRHYKTNLSITRMLYTIIEDKNTLTENKNTGFNYFLHSQTEFCELHMLFSLVCLEIKRQCQNYNILSRLC
jgi:hypothetical protein